MKDKRKPRLLYITEAMGGGVFSYLVDLSNELCSSFDIYIAYGVRPQTPKNLKNYFDSRIHLIKVVNFARSLNPINDIKAFFEIKKIAHKIQPDLIHLHSSKAGVLGRFAFNGKKVPLFYTPHGYSFLMENYHSISRLMFKSIEKICALRNCTTVSCSVGEHQETLKLTSNAVCINNGINIQKLGQIIQKNKNELKITHYSNSSLSVFTLGRITEQKNPTLFNDIALSMPDIQFIWIGDGELRSVLTAPNIKVTGWLDRDKAIRQTLNCQIFLLTSLWEGLPISLLEAMYMKKLCIVSDVIGNQNVIHNKKNGYLCKKLNDYVYSIKRVNSPRTDKIINNSFEDVIQQYNVKVMQKKYRILYLKSLKVRYKEC